MKKLFIKGTAEEIDGYSVDYISIPEEYVEAFLNVGWKETPEETVLEEGS
ncbi:hypothetical protein CENTIMANUS_00367 [Klebsiella phage vB_KpM_Centimanus]